MKALLSPIALVSIWWVSTVPATSAITIVAGGAIANQVNVGDAYTQNFNTLAQSGTNLTWTDDSTLVGWYADKTSYSATGGGAATAGVMYSYGAAEQGGPLSDRALGAQASTTVSVNVGLQLINGTGGTINTVDIGFFLEQWNASATPNSPVSFSYQIFAAGSGSLTTGAYTSVPGLSATPNLTQGTKANGTTGTGAIIGNLHATELGGSLENLEWQNGDELWLRWTFTKTSGPNTHIGLENVSVTIVPEPLAPFLSALLALGLLRRRRL